MTVSLAVRNLLRNRRRSLATLLAMAIGCCAILLFGGFKTNIQYMMHTHLVQRGGHFQVQHQDFFLYGSGNPIAYGITDYGQILKAIREDPVLSGKVLVASPTMQFGGIAGNYAAGVSRTVIGNGYVAEDVNRMGQWNEFDLSGSNRRFGLEGSKPDAAIIGMGVARVLQLCEQLKIAQCPKPQLSKSVSAGDGHQDTLPNDIAQLAVQEGAGAKPGGQLPSVSEARVELLIGSARGAPNVTTLEIIRAEDQGVKELDEVVVLMHLAHVQQLIYGKSPPKVTSIMVQLRNSAQMPEVRQRLTALLEPFSKTQPLAVLDLYQLSPFFVQTIGMFDTIFGFVFILIGGIVLFTVSNTMSTAVVERTVEIGTLRSIGVRRAGIKILFITEGALLGFFGALFGVVLALLISSAINHMDLTWWPPGNVEPFPLTMTVWGETWMIMGTSMGLMAIAVLSAWWPARRAAQLSVVDALRHV